MYVRLSARHRLQSGTYGLLHARRYAQPPKFPLKPNMPGLKPLKKEEIQTVQTQGKSIIRRRMLETWEQLVSLDKKVVPQGVKQTKEKWVQFMAEQGHRRAAALLDQDDTAIQQTKKKAEEGEPQYMLKHALHVLYKQNNAEEAAAWLRKAARLESQEGGEVEAISYLAFLKLLVGREEEGVGLLQAAANRNEPMALFVLGFANFHGLGGLAQDATKGRQLISLSSELENEIAMTYLALDLLTQDKKVNEKEALRLLKQAASKGYSLAQFELAKHYLSLEDFKNDDEVEDANLSILERVEEGFMWAVKSSDQDLNLAHILLGRAYEGGGVVPADVEKAYMYYCKADPSLGQNFLFKESLLLEEEGKRDEAAKLWRRCAADDHVASIHRLCASIISKFYENEKKISNSDREELLKYLEKASSQGDRQSSMTLAWLHWEGIIVPKDLPKSMKYYIEAAKEDKRAQFIVGAVLTSVPGKHEEAIMHLREAAKELPVAQYALGCVLLMAADMDRKSLALPVEEEKKNELAKSERQKRREGWDFLALAISNRVTPAITILTLLMEQQQKDVQNRTAKPIFIKLQKPLSEGTSWFYKNAMEQAKLIALGDVLDSEFYNLQTPDNTVETLFRFALQQRDLARDPAADSAEDSGKTLPHKNNNNEATEISFSPRTASPRRRSSSARDRRWCDLF